MYWSSTSCVGRLWVKCHWSVGWYMDGPIPNMHAFVLKCGNFIEQNNPHPSPSIQSCSALFSLFEVCKMLERPFRANCLKLFCWHALLIIINRIHTVCCQYFVLSIVCLYFYAFAGQLKWLTDYYRNWEAKDFERVYYVPWK